MIDELPSEIIVFIKGYLWGTNKSWKNKLNIAKQDLVSKYNKLKVSKLYRIRGVDLECEDEFYCPGCGEKTLFPFTREFCWDCDPLPFNKSTYNTWSAGYQSKIWINHRLIEIPHVKEFKSYLRYKR